MHRFKMWMNPTEDPMEGRARFHRLAAASALVAAALVILWSALPMWGMPINLLPRFQNLILMFAAAFALLAGGCLGAAALIKRGLY